MSKLIIPIVASFLLLTPLRLTAQELSHDVSPPAADALPPGGLPLSALLTEAEMRLMFDYLRDAMTAAFKGEPYRRPPEQAQTLARSQERLMRRGNAAVRKLRVMIRRDLKRALEALQPPVAEPKVERTRHGLP